MTSTNYDFDIVEMSWKGVSFPTADVSFSFDHNLVEHKYPNRNSAHIENMGRSPIMITAKALFDKNISRGRGETWDFGTLFPLTFNNFLAKCAETTPGKLQHPLYGSIDCMVKSFSYDLSAERRSGVVADVKWIETIKNEVVPDTVDVLPDAKANAQAIDDIFNRDHTQPMKALKSFTTISFTDLIDKVTSLVSYGTLVSSQLFAAINRVKYHVDRLLFEINKYDSVTYAQLKIYANNLKDAYNYLFSSAPEKGYVDYKVLHDTTLASLTQLTGSKLSTLIRKNPTVIRTPIVKGGTIIKVLKK